MSANEHTEPDGSIEPSAKGLEADELPAGNDLTVGGRDAERHDDDGLAADDVAADGLADEGFDADAARSPYRNVAEPLALPTGVTSIDLLDREDRI